MVGAGELNTENNMKKVLHAAVAFKLSKKSDSFFLNSNGFLTRFLALMIVHGFAIAVLPLGECRGYISGLVNGICIARSLQEETITNLGCSC